MHTTRMKKIHIIGIFIAQLLLITSLVKEASAQNTGIQFERYSTKDGLSQSSVLAILQDDEGFLWLGTYAGLDRFDGYNFKGYRHHYINTNNISGMHIRSIVQDTAGILLISTTTGVNRFFTYTGEFVNFSHDPNDTNSLSNNTVYRILKDRDGDIWLATWGGGLEKMEKIPGNVKDERQAKFGFVHHVPGKGPHAISSAYIADLAESEDGLIWIATNNGLNIYDKKTNQFTVLHHDDNDENSLSLDDVSSVCPDKNGNIWVGTWEGGLNLYERSSGIFLRFKSNPKDKTSLSNDIIMTLFCDQQGTVWIGTWGGGLNRVIISEPPAGKDITVGQISFQSFKNNNIDVNSISGNSIYSIYQDNSGMIWVGTDWAGLNKFKLQATKFQHKYAEQKLQNNLVSNIVYSLARYKNNKLWIGTDKGLNLYDLQTDKFELFQSDPNNKNTISHNHVRTILIDRDENVWIGTENGLNRYLPESNSFQRYNSIFSSGEKSIIISLCQSPSGEIWIGTYGDGLYRFNPKTKDVRRYRYNKADPKSLSDDIVWSILEDKNRLLWIGTTQGGLCRFNPDSEFFERFVHDPDDSTSLSNDFVISLQLDHNNNLWIGTRKGLNKLEYNTANTPIFKHYSEKDGLSSPTINGIIEDKIHQLWLTTTHGLTRFDPAKNSFSAYYTEDGLQGNEFSINAICIDSLSDEIFIGGTNGFNMFFPKEIGSNIPPPKTKIIDLKLFHQSVQVEDTIDNRVILTEDIAYTDEIVLTRKEYIISFEYAALQYQSPFTIQYAYRLDGYEKDWNYVHNERIATYRNLPPGHYVFWVKAANKDGIWSDEPTGIRLYIKPPWWNTWFFKIMVALIIVSSVLSIYFLRIKILKTQQHQLEAKVSERTEQLREVNILLEEKQEEISLQNEELLRHRFELEKLVDERTSELKTAKLKAEESDKLKSAFLANMSHEIRTPMNAIIGFSSLLEDEIMEADEREYYIKMIKNSSDTLLTLINDIIDISRIEANLLVLYKEQFCLEDIIDEIYAYFSLKNKKNVDLQIIKSNIPSKTCLYNDPIRFRQILTNLIGNALKFTEKGYVRIGYKIIDKKVEIFVEDSGIGINKKDQKFIFDHFYKLESSAEKFYEGTGIGLAISKKLVELMGGEINFKSKPGQGSTFYFTFPVTELQVEETKLAEKQKSRQKFNLKGINLVIAEDEPNNYKLMEKILQKTKANLIWVKNGKEAVELFKDRDFHRNSIVLMDIKMPVMNGIEANKQIKNMNDKIPVIAVTAYAQTGDRLVMLQHGFDDYISKPIKPQELLNLLTFFKNKLS